MDAREAADVVEITQLVNRYGHALDSKRYQLLEQVFTPGARLDYELEGGEPGSYPEMVAVFEEFLTAFSYTQHVFSQPVIDLEGDRAHATCRLVATHVQQRPRWKARNVARGAISRPTAKAPRFSTQAHAWCAQPPAISQAPISASPVHDVE